MRVSLPGGSSGLLWALRGALSIMIDQDTFLTVFEIADLLKVNQQTVRNWIDAGSLPAVRIGSRRVRVRASDLDRFIAAGSAAPSAERPQVVTDAPSRERAEPDREDPEASEARARFGRALGDAVQKLTGPDTEGFVGALKELAGASSALAEALSR
jgi:excisionase family DNA binding protein